MSTTETPARLLEQPGMPPRRRGALIVAAVAALAVVGALLWLGYYRLSWTVPATSDGAAIALQAQDMLHGNWLLSGWMVGDVSFWTTELPEYALVELIRHLGTDVIHVAAAATYTLLVLLATALAMSGQYKQSLHQHNVAEGSRGVRGGVPPGETAEGSRGVRGVVPPVITAAIMLAPQLGYGAFVLLLSPDHVGTEVPLLLGWLVLDLAPRRWWVPVSLGLLLAWTQVGDQVTVLTAVAPLIIVCLVRVFRSRERWFELGLAGAAVASVAAAKVAEALLTRAGWFTVYPVNLTLAPVRQLWTHTWLTGWGIQELYGANFTGVSGWPRMFFAVVHVAGLALAAAGFALALWRFLRLRAGADLVESVLAVAIVCNLVSYVLSIDPGTVRGTGYDAREIAAVLPLGAVLAGRVIGPKLTRVAAPRVRSGYAALCLCLLACYGAALAYGAAQPAAPADNADLTSWLAGHHLSYGLGRAESNIVTVDSGGRVHLAVVADRGGRVSAQLYQSERSWYDPRLHVANFVVASTPPGTPAYAPDLIAVGDARRTFGPPARIYHFRGYTVLVWNVNLLTRLRLAIQATWKMASSAGGSVASLTCWKGAPMLHAETYWNKFVGIARARCSA